MECHFVQKLKQNYQQKLIISFSHISVKNDYQRACLRRVLTSNTDELIARLEHYNGNKNTKGNSLSDMYAL